MAFRYYYESYQSNIVVLIYLSPQYYELMDFRPHPNSAFKFYRPLSSSQPQLIHQIDNDWVQSPLQSGFQLIAFSQLRQNLSEIKQTSKTVNSPVFPCQNSKTMKQCQGNIEVKVQQARKVVKTRKFPYNDTKNIPKNFGKAIIAFSQKNPEIIKKCLQKYGLSYQDFIFEIRRKKKYLHSIKQLRALWLNSEFVFAASFRQISLYFMRRVSLKYIFGSRISDFQGHLKYRKRIMSALRYPQDFHSIKHE